MRNLAIPFKNFAIPVGMVPTASSNLPFTVDFSLLSDGSLPSSLIGSNWTIATAKGVCTPTLSTEMIANTGFEGTYTDGLAASWSKSTTGTPVESADFHLGAKAQEFTGAGANTYVQQSFTGAASTWYRMGGWGKRTAGTTGNVYHYLQSTSLNMSSVIDSAAYTERVLTRLVTTSETIRPRAASQPSAGTSDTIIIDDCSLKPITFASCFTFGRLPFSSPNVHVRTKITQSSQAGAGVALCWDSPTNPQNGLILVADKSNLRLFKYLNGAWSSTLISIGYTYSAGDYIGLSMNGGSVKAWSGPYNGYYQRGTTQTVSDAGIVNNRYHGLFSTDPVATFGGVGFEAGAAASASGTSTTPKVMLLFDDFNGTDYSEAYSYLSSVGLKGTSVGPSSVVGTGSYLTLANMQTMYAYGWDFGMHETLSGLSQSAQEALIQADRNYLETNGMPRAARCSKAHSTDGNSLAAFTAQGIRADIGNGSVSLTYTPANYVIPGFAQTTVYDHTVAEILASISTAIVTNKQHFMVPFHAITTDSGLYISPTKFHDIIDGIVSAGYSTMTLSEYVAMMRY